MTEQTKATIVIDAQTALHFIQNMLPILETAGVAIPGPVGLGVSAAAAMLVPLLAQIPTADVITPQQQLDLLNRIAKLLDFSGPQWALSTAPAPKSAATTPPVIKAS